MTAIEIAKTQLSEAIALRDTAQTEMVAIAASGDTEAIIKASNELAELSALVKTQENLLASVQKAGRATVEIGQRRVDGNGKVQAKGGSLIVKDLEHSRVGTLQTEFALEMIANSRDVQVATVEAIAEAFASDRPRQLPAEKGRFGTNFNPTSWGGCRVADPDVALNLLIVAANKIGYALPESLVGDADTTIQPLIAPEDRVTVSAPSGPR